MTQTVDTTPDDYALPNFQRERVRAVLLRLSINDHHARDLMQQIASDPRRDNGRRLRAELGYLDAETFAIRAALDREGALGENIDLAVAITESFDAKLSRGLADAPSYEGGSLRGSELLAYLVAEVGESTYTVRRWLAEGLIPGVHKTDPNKSRSHFYCADPADTVRRWNAGERGNR